MKQPILIFLFFLSMSCLGQSFQEKDLLSMTYQSLTELYESNKKDTAVASLISRAYINKARSTNDSINIAKGYEKLALVSKRSKALRALDTTIIFSKKSIDKQYPTRGYLLKSHYLYGNEEYEKSLKNAILGYQYAKEKENVADQITALHQINGINELWGDHESALESEFLNYKLLFENKELPNFNSYYISTLEGIGKCYVKLNKPDSALHYFKEGIHQALQYKDSASYFAFVSRTGTALYAKGEYKQALDSLDKANTYSDYFNKSYWPLYYYFKGSCLYKLDSKEDAMRYFSKVDSIYEKRHVLHPELPLTYNTMVSYYKSIDDTEKQLAYLNKMVLVIRLINVKKIYIKEKTDTDYLIPALLDDKETEIEELTQRNSTHKTILWVSLSVLFVCLIALGYYFERQKVFKKRFEKLMENQQSNAVEIQKPIEEKPGISKSLMMEILEALDSFEKEKGYLSKTLTLNSMAKTCNTNSTYLSKVINLQKEKNFSNYINDLRIDYAIQQLRNDSKFRKYTIKAIAGEVGFKSAESFSKAFYKNCGIYPSYYIKKIEGVA